MKSFRIFSILPSFTATALLLQTAHAGFVIWGPARNISGESDVSLNGALLSAFNLNAPEDVGSGPVVASAPAFGSTVLAFGDTTVNGVPFNAFTVTTGMGSASQGNATLVPTVGNLVAGNVEGSPVAPFGALTVPYQSLLNSLVGTVSSPGSMNLTLNGLTPGGLYEFEWWYNQSSIGTAATDQTALAGNSRTLDGNTTNAAGGTGQFAIGTFLATDPSQTINFSSAGNAALNAFQLRVLSAPIPEPGTALFGVALGGVVFLRRRFF